jgi:protein arginine N-methyltransferase 2
MDFKALLSQWIENESDVYSILPGSTLLHAAVSAGDLESVQLLLSKGHPWNVVDENSKSAGELAQECGYPDIYDYLVAEGTRVELLLSALGIRTHDESPDEPTNAVYLASKLTYEEGKLLDDESNGVMMGWEAPLMKYHAELICPEPGKRILNIGFGLGIIDTEIQKRQPSVHTIIEAHPDVYMKMIDDGWDKKPGVQIIFGRWQDVMDQLTHAYDGIFFDTFGEYYDDLHEFHEHLPNILEQDGIYSYFNGLCGTNSFFHDVSCNVCECHLSEMGIETTYQELEMDTLGDDVWKGIKRAYFSLNTYRLPKCKFIV